MAILQQNSINQPGVDSQHGPKSLIPHSQLKQPHFIEETFIGIYNCKKDLKKKRLHLNFEQCLTFSFIGVAWFIFFTVSYAKKIKKEQRLNDKNNLYVRITVD